MSVYYVKNYKESSSKLLYSKRLLYKVNIKEPEYENLFDFTFAEKQLYGRVTRVFEPMMLSPSQVLKGIASESESANAQQVLPFVADAFTKLNQQFAKKAMVGEIDVNDKYLSTLVAYKSYENPQKLYNEHLITYKETLAKSFRSRNESISNFDEFISVLMPALARTAYKSPFTMTAYVKSTFCPISVSGLAIEIANVSYINDQEKIALFKRSPNWHFYLNACRTYGFMVDSNVPWRLVADIGSAQMIEYAKQYGLLSTDEILNGLYLKVGPRYFKQFKTGLYSLYNAIKAPTYERKVCPDGTLRVTRIPAATYTLDSFKEKYGDLHFLKLYFQVRFMEEESQFNENERHRLIDDCLEIAARSVGASINIFERILNKTFDYNGSLDYIIKKRNEMEFNDDGILPSY